tara:strand:- start:100 stop:357 length:258 start_codon:yes stop_codon:yes gene_type:complete
MGGKPTQDKTLFSTHLDRTLVDAVRNCIAALDGTPHELRLSDFCGSALGTELRRLEELANDGKPFAKRKHQQLRVGRPRTMKVSQ